MSDEPITALRCEKCNTQFRDSDERCPLCYRKMTPPQMAVVYHRRISTQIPTFEKESRDLALRCKTRRTDEGDEFALRLETMATALHRWQMFPPKPSESTEMHVALLALFTSVRAYLSRSVTP
jgi:hypothetical protein